jgi:hypothetical protein
MRRVCGAYLEETMKNVKANPVNLIFVLATLFMVSACTGGPRQSVADKQKVTEILLDGVWEGKAPASIDSDYCYFIFQDSMIAMFTGSMDDASWNNNSELFGEFTRVDNVLAIKEDRHDQISVRYQVGDTLTLISERWDNEPIVLTKKQPGKETPFQGIWEGKMDTSLWNFWFYDDTVVFLLAAGEGCSAFNFSYSGNHAVILASVEWGVDFNFTLSGDTLNLTIPDYPVITFARKSPL